MSNAVSDGKIQITILILRRGALSNQTDVSFTTILDEIVVSLKGKQEQIKTIKYFQFQGFFAHAGENIHNYCGKWRKPGRCHLNHPCACAQ